MSNLDRDLAEMKRLGYTSYGKYKLDYPNTRSSPKPAPSLNAGEFEALEVGIHDYICKCCGSSFAATRAGRKFCSTACCRLHAKRQYNLRQRENKGHPTPSVAVCPKCGREFIKKGNLRYCGPECRDMAARKLQKERDRKRRGKHDDTRL